MIELRNPVTWVYAALAVVGIIGLAPLMSDAYQGSPLAFLVAAVGWTAFGLAVAWLIRRISRGRPRPRGATLAAFGFGAVIATGLGRWTTTAFSDIVDAVVADDGWSTALSAGISEELLKILGVAALALFAASRMRSALDFVYYGAFVGLGFTVVESLLYSATNAAGADSPVITVIGFLFVRGVFSLLWSHATYTAIAAIGLWALLRWDAPAARRWLGFWAMLLLSMLVHILFDAPFLEDSAALAFFVKGVPVAAVFLAIYLPMRARAGRASSPV
ncbi:PrsW family intramembrane metalloprotease [Demequina pelophila]|uniref:PrsW family intramembrane metalloprotease n=1 Tax=Demequina pelophila TaxID=1638984 RepID=UPI0007810DBD|nr:PrsW family glutamic-type intramembrane protease [Demequina pelophila]